MLLESNTDLFKPLVPKAPNSECQNTVTVSSQSVEASLWIFTFFAPSALMG